jgi:hypothetical protein
MIMNITVHNTWFKKWKLCASGILSSGIKDGDVLYSNVVPHNRLLQEQEFGPTSDSSSS